MSGKVLAACRHAVFLKASDYRCAKPGHRLRVVAERPIADHRIPWIGVDIQHWSVIERNADGLEFLRERHSKTIGEFVVAAATQRGHRRPLRKRRMQASDAST